MLALDVEANSLEWWSPDFVVFLIQWDDGHGDRGYWREGQPYDAVHAALARHTYLVGANFGYDTHALRAAGVVDLAAGRWKLHDVQTLARVALPGRFRYGLEELGTDLLGADATAGQRALKAAAAAHKLSWTKEDKDYYGLWKLEPDLMIRYGMEDVDLTIRLWNLIWSQTSGTDKDVYQMEMAGVSPVLRAAEAWGVRIDPERLAALKSHLEGERDEYRCLLLAQGLTDEALGGCEEHDKASTNALLRDLLHIGVPLYKKTPKSGAISEKTGKRAPDRLSVNKDDLAEFKLSHPVVSDLIQWRSRNQILRTFVAAMEKANPRVHTSFRQSEARTSRMSSAKPNMQNLPRPGEDNDGDPEAQALALGVRRVIVPEPGNALLVADFDSIEMLVLAYYSGNEELIAMLEAGMDPHAATAAKVYGGQYEDYLKGGPGDKRRTDAKTTTFRTVYGGGARLTSVQLGICIAEAAKLVADIKAAIPGYNDLNDRIKNTVAGRAFPHVKTILGRRLYVPREKPYVAPNTVIQGTSAELMKLALVAAAPVLATFGYRVILVVHDELLAEGPAGNAEAALVSLIAAMEGAYPLRPALKVTGAWSTDSYAACK